MQIQESELGFRIRIQNPISDSDSDSCPATCRGGTVRCGFAPACEWKVKQVVLKPATLPGSTSNLKVPTPIKGR